MTYMGRRGNSAALGRRAKAASDTSGIDRGCGLVRFRMRRSCSLTGRPRSVPSVAPAAMPTATPTA
jgi:hypothetical protein